MKNYLKQKRWQPSPIQPFYRFLWGGYNLYRFIRHSDYRSRIVYGWQFRGQYHQSSNFTQLNRYPDLFEMAKQHFLDVKQPRILSFGCSTGEEVATIAAHVPQASLVGVDINKWCLAQAAQHFSQPNWAFHHSLSKDFEAATDFDAIFCLAVFQRAENRHDQTRQESAYSFEQFESQLRELDKKLKPKGLLFIDQCDFNFMETKLMRDYRIAPFADNLKPRERPLFNQHNKKVTENQVLFRIFEKR